MLQRFRNYLTPMVTTVALALLGATALAVTPGVNDLLGDESDTSRIEVNEDLISGENETSDTDNQLDTEDLIVDPMVNDGDDGVTPTATPTATPANEKPNHGHYVSCITHMAKNDPSVQGSEKGAIVSYAARQKGEETQLAKGASCDAQYNAAKAAALNGTETEQDQTEAGQASVRQEQKAQPQLEKEVPAKTGATQVQPQGQGAGGPEQVPPPAVNNGGGRGPKA